jgi:hypothetical protein
MMDEDCSGIVKKDGIELIIYYILEYYDCLSAYGINEER